MTVAPPPAGTEPGWQPDPFRRHELRFHDGTLWTEHVSDRGISAIDTVPVAELPRSRPVDRTAGAVEPPLAEGTAARVLPQSPGGPAGMIDAPVLVVDDAATAPRHRDGREQAVRDEHGNLVGTVRTGVESIVARSLRMLTTDPVPEITSIDVFDGAGARAFTLDRPARLLKPRVFVAWGDGTAAGEIVPQKLLNGLRYTIEVGGVAEALLEASDEGDRPAWVIDRQGTLLARVSTKWEVPSASLHPIPNTHLVLRERVLPQPLGVVVLAALLALDGMLLGPL